MKISSDNLYNKFKTGDVLSFVILAVEKSGLDI